MIPDGTYDVFILDATDDDASSAVWLSVTIVAGDHKGHVVDLSATGLDRSSIDLLGMPATLTVADGEPALRVDDA